MYQWYICVLNLYKLQYYYYLFLYITVLQFKYDYYLFDFQNLDFYDKGKRSRENLFTTYIKFESLSGAYYYLTKPIKREVLLSTIHAAIQDHEHQKELLTKLKQAENSFRLLDEAVFHFHNMVDLISPKGY